jgi:hypothetical protein
MKNGLTVVRYETVGERERKAVDSQMKLPCRILHEIFFPLMQNAD